MTSSLNQGQAHAANEFLKFLFSSDPEFIISGPPGTGKTHLMKHLMDVVMPAYLDTCKMMGIEPQFITPNITATTNKATSTLSDMTGWPADTIHSFLRLKVKDDWSTGKSILTKSLQWMVHTGIVLFIDEASMVDRELLKMIREGTHKSKIVYIGDKHQLNPVGEKVSPVFGGGIPMVELTEPMRTKDPHLQALNLQLRETVETGVFKPIKIVRGVIDYLDDEQLKKALDYYYAAQGTDHRILAYTNARVVMYNNYIRGLRQLPPELSVGERVVNTNFIQMKDRKMPVEAEYTVTRIGKRDICKLEEVELEVVHIDLEDNRGVPLYDVRVPVDNGHFNELLKWYGKKKKFQTYYMLKNTYAELRPRDAATVHKAQGSTYETTLVDLTNISTCNQADQVARMLLVAASRARSRVLLYGTLAEKYGGLVF